jgi:hypothetical protein
MWRAGAGRRELRLQGIQVRPFPGSEDQFQLVGQFSLASPLMGECEQTDHDAAGNARRFGGDQSVPSIAERCAREQLIAVDQVEQCMRLA